jgi:hypothetical protein
MKKRDSGEYVEIEEWKILLVLLISGKWSIVIFSLFSLIFYEGVAGKYRLIAECDDISSVVLFEMWSNVGNIALFSGNILLFSFFFRSLFFYFVVEYYFAYVLDRRWREGRGEREKSRERREIEERDRKKKLAK